MPINDPVIERMQLLLERWEASADPKAVFLSCYQMMTGNMLAAIDQNEFIDPHWVDHLLRRFAEYYFVALDEYEQEPTSAPLVWQLAHGVSINRSVSGIQKLLLGVNAHINYDLVLALMDLLEPEWRFLSDEQREKRHLDHRRVNDIIGRTIDAVQDEVIEPDMPVMDLIDKLFGPVDEYLVSRLIANWRETVWENTLDLLQADDPQERAMLIKKVEEEAIRIGGFIQLGRGVQ
jgi:hypothetical protein